MMEYAKDIPLGKMLSEDVLAVIVDPNVSWILCTLMFLGLCEIIPWVEICIMSLSLMIIHTRQIYLLKSKGQVFEKFHEFKPLFENDTGTRIR